MENRGSIDGATMRKLVYFALLTVFGIVVASLRWRTSDAPQMFVDLHQVKSCGINTSSSTEFLLDIEGERFVTDPSETFRRWQWAVLSQGETNSESFPEIVAVRRSNEPTYPYLVSINGEWVRAKRR
jgi:hypothetical protein